ncbi:MAG: 1,4-beta-glucanase [Oscillospiraceae bacterium]|nr:1,4-beta-glucanase [Oscillospiraceae bacterium]
MRKGNMRLLAAAAAAITALGAALPPGTLQASAATESIADTMKWGTLRIGGGGFVSGIVTGKKVMFARTDVGGAYKYNYDTESWEQLLGFINDFDRGLLSVDAMAIDPTDDDTVYFLCGCAYFSAEKTVIYKTTDGGKTFKEFDVTNLIKVMGNGHGRQCGESIAVDPDNPNVIYAGGDVTADTDSKSALIKSTDGGETWEPVEGYDALGLFDSTTKWPTWTDNIVRCVADGEYQTQNGVAAIAVTGGKVYVGTSKSGTANVHVASTKDDKFSALSKDLPTNFFPSRINLDPNGDLLITYMAGINFGGANGGGYRYHPADGKVTQLFDGAGLGSMWADPSNPDHLITSTCGKFEDQEWQEWTPEHSATWGDQYYRSFDGGKTWQNFTPGHSSGWHQPLISDYLQDGGYAWIRDKAIHWSGTVVTDPVYPDRMWITSGNGVFVCTNVWSQDDASMENAKLPTYTFHPDGIEEVVSLDFVSTPDGLNLSAIGDYDGFVHEAVDQIGLQYQPNMGSTSAIAVCPQNTDVWARIAEGDNGSGYYTTDRGMTWTAFTAATKGGKLAIAETAKGKYRVFNTGKSDGGVAYSDDWGKSWNKCEGIPSQYGSKPTMLLVEPEDPNTVYAYATYFNSSWHYSKPEPTAEDAQYKICVSTDGGKTFTSTDVCMYDQCDSAGRIGWLGKGELMLGGGWYGMYRASVKDGKVTVTKVDGISYCKTLGYGAPEKAGGVNTIYMYGKPLESDPEGIYRSTDAGKTWVCINTDHLYGGTGNGNYLVGDMKTFGKVYMSTVGCGIVYGELSDSTPPSVTEPKETETTAPDKTDILWGDADCSGEVDVSDTVLIARYFAEEKDAVITKEGKANADVTHDGKIGTDDGEKILLYVAKLIKEADLAKA